MKQLSPVERELSVVVPGTEIAKELDRAYRELSQKVRLKGFRQGKVPRYVLEQYYKADTEQRVLEHVVGASFREAVKSHSIEPVANPQIKTAGELIPGMDFAYSAKVEVKPVVEIKQFAGLELKRTRYEVTDADVDAELESLRERHAKVVAVEGRDTVQQGDLVETNWSGEVDGEHVKGLSGLSYVVEVGAGTFPFKEAEQALVGKKVDDNFTLDVKVPDDYRTEALRGKTARLTFKVLGLKHKTLPMLDDEFAKDLSDEVESLEQLRAKIRTDMGEMAKARTETETRNVVVEALIDKNPFDLPQALVTRAAEQIAAEKLNRLPQQQAEMLWQARGVQLKEDARPAAIKQVRMSLILEELVKREKVEISDADIEAHFEKVAAELGSTVKNVKNVYKKGRRMDELRFQLSTARMLERVIEQAKFEDTVKPALGS
ncbi:MAG: trigger factor [Deltaproteobacteria bacterium RBG_16_71_12]|nr:MAG: trigger factor [Deltaproteobacteria bacterium RBG_16_71_12]